MLRNCQLSRGVMPIMVSALMMISGLAHAKLDPKIASKLMDRFNDKVTTCAGNKPAFMCSGIMIRGINKANKLPHAWSLKQ